VHDFITISDIDLHLLDRSMEVIRERIGRFRMEQKLLNISGRRVRIERW